MAVRDVRHRTSDGERFAAAFDNGTVQVWDVRFPKSCEVRFTAHDMALTVDWHPEACDLLASGGRDGYIKVWNYDSLENDDLAESSKSVLHRYHNPGDADAKVVRSLTPMENNTPAYTIQTVGASVTRVRWRPNHYYHIASCSSRGGSISLWNVAEPNIPLAQLGKYSDPVVSFEWKDQFLQKKDVHKSSLYECWWRSESEQDSEVQDRTYEEFNTTTVNSTFSEAVTGDNAKELGGVLAMHEQRFDVYHNRIHKYQDHSYKSEAEAETSWGLMVCSSKISGVQCLSLEKAVKPLNFLHPSCISISPRGHLAILHDHIDKDHTEKALRVVSRRPSALSLAQAKEKTGSITSTASERKKSEAEGTEAQDSTRAAAASHNKHVIRIYANTDEGGVLLDSQRFVTLAENYHTPQTMRMERDKRYEDMQQNFANRHPVDGDAHAAFRDAHAVCASCDHNAKGTSAL